MLLRTSQARGLFVACGNRTQLNFDLSRLRQTQDLAHKSTNNLIRALHTMGIKTKAGKNGDHESSYAIKDVVLAKLRGYPAWPGLVSSRVELSPPSFLNIASSRL
jgi:hypothetical protein